MTLTELRYIVTLAEERHFGKAAERCHVSQPTLSVAVKKLEDELEVPLFERGKGTISLTDTGDRVVRQARVVLSESARLRDIALAGRDPLRSPLRIGAIYTVGPYLFPHLMPQLHRAAPEMALYIEEDYTAGLREKLRRSELDVIVVALPFQEAEVVTLPLYDEPFVVLLPAEHPLTQASEISADQLMNQKLLMLGPGHCFRDQVIEACPALFRDSGRSEGPGLVTEGSSLDTIRHMVAGGMGISVLPSSAAGVDRYPAGMLVTRPFVSPAPFRTVAMAWRVSFPRPKAIEVLKRAAAQCRILPVD